MGESPSPPVNAKYQYDSFDLEHSSSISPSPTLTIPQGRDGERATLIAEVIRLYRERYRLARMHRKLELRVVVSLKRRRQSEDGDDNGDDDEDEGAGVDWAGQVTKARASLIEADKKSSAQELQYRLLLEDSKTKAEQSASQAEETMRALIEQQRNLVKRSFSALPPEKDRKETIEGLLQKQLQVKDQLQDARAAYFSLAIKKQQLEEEFQRQQDINEDQVNNAEMLRLVVETESFIEEIGVQESTIMEHKASLKKTDALISKCIHQKKELQNEIKETANQVEQLKQQLKQEKAKLKGLSERQAEVKKKKATLLKPQTRLVLDPMLAEDLETKLTLKVTLEDELQRLKASCKRNKKTDDT